MHEAELPEGWDSVLPTYTPEDKGDATQPLRQNQCSGWRPSRTNWWFCRPGFQQDLLKSSGDFQKGHENRNIRFGVREHGMGAICNGLALDGSGLIAYVLPFMCFTDYMRAAIRLSAPAGVIYIMTHDSIALGEDGPPTSRLNIPAAVIPDLLVIRPADGNETSGAYKVAIQNRTRPSILALSRQNLPNLPGTSIEGVTKGGYILSDSDGTPDLILIGTGSETQLCVKAAEQGEGKKVR